MTKNAVSFETGTTGDNGGKFGLCLRLLDMEKVHYRYNTLTIKE